MPVRLVDEPCATRQQDKVPTKREKNMGKIRVAIIGVGNCASSLVQGVHFYRDATADDFIPGGGNDDD